MKSQDAMDNLLTELILFKHFDTEGRLSKDRIFIEDLVYDSRHQPFEGVHSDFRGVMSDEQAQVVIDHFLSNEWTVEKLPDGGVHLEQLIKEAEEML